MEPFTASRYPIPTMHHENLWAPWRLAYIRSLESDKAAIAGNAQPVCFLCDAAKTADNTPAGIDRLILRTDARGSMLMNRYPYTTGHLLVAPAAHVASLNDLSAGDRAGLMELVAEAEQLVRDSVNPQGVNIGINLGRAAGAGVPGHLHVHIIPRWNGDTNFMDVVGGVRVIPGALEEVYQHMRNVLAGKR